MEPKADKQSSVFVRPNLKGFVLGGICILAVQAVMSGGESKSDQLAVTRAEAGRPGSTNEVQRLIAQASEQPSSEILLRLSRHYEKKGDYRRAIQYLRKADRMDQYAEEN